MDTILLVAEQPTVIESFTEMLSTTYNVLQVATVEDGLSALKENFDMVAAVLIELRLARESGFAFVEWMKQYSTFSTIPLIAISDALPVRDDMDCIEHGFFDLITEFAPAQLVHKRISNAIRAKDSLSLTEVEKMLKQLPACIFLKDTEGKYVFSTQIWNHLNTEGDPNWTIRGKTDLDIRKDKENAIRAMAADRRILETGEGTEYIIEENQDGVREFLQLIKRPVYDEAGNVNGIIALINNVTDHQLLKLELEKRAKTDEMTGLLNKSASQELVRIMLENYRREDDHSALLMIDADHFKRINDTFGHAVGDKVLAEIGRIIKNSCRSDDVAGRIGGDEFMVFMRNATAENACRLAERLQDEVRRAFKNEPTANCVSLSVGIALCPKHGLTFEALFKAADDALYVAKADGRATYRMCPYVNKTYD